MSSYKGKSVKNKSKARRESKIMKIASEQEGSPLKELLRKPTCRYCGIEAYKSDSEGYICENMAYKGKCKPLKEESVESRLKYKPDSIIKIGYNKDLELVDNFGNRLEEIPGEGISGTIDRHLEQLKQENNL